MWVSFLQKATILFFMCNIISSAQSLVIKRSPLEIGYATFPNEVVRHKNVAILNKALEEDDIAKNNLDVVVSPSISKIHQSQEWIPGQIRHHSFIPAHVHHIYVPLLLNRDIQAVLVKPQENLYFYPRHYGGFGVGAYTGGQGAGHGFQIIFNS